MNNKKFTVRDFIAYNNPCFGCGNAINFTIGSVACDYSTTGNGLVFLRPTVKQGYTEVDLKLTYFDAVKLIIFHKTNKIETNNVEGLTKYLSNHTLFLRSLCNVCDTIIETDSLHFNFDVQHVEAVEIRFENLFIVDKDKEYNIESYFIQDISIIRIAKLVASNLLSSTQFISSPQTTLKLPLLPKYRFKDKQQLLEKLKLFVLFS